MPVYNAERFVAEAIESILAQTYTDFELLITDDGSTDGSGAILRRYAGSDGRIRLVSRPNVGLSGTLNEMVDRARGEFLARMDADDISMPERLEIQADYLRAHPECLVVGSRVLAVDTDGDPLCEWTREQTHEEIEAELLSIGRGPGMLGGAVMMRREAVLAVGKYRESSVEDRDLFLRLGERGRLANVPQALLRYRQHPSSLCHVPGQCRNDMHRSIHRVVLEAHERRGLDPSRLRAMEPWSPLTPAVMARTYGWWALRSGHVRSARKHAWSRLRHAPFSRDSWKLFYCALRGH